MKTMTDNEKLECYERKMKQVTIDLFSKKITSEEFAKKFDKYCFVVNYYRKKLNKLDLFENNNTDNNPDEQLQIVNNIENVNG